MEYTAPQANMQAAQSKRILQDIERKQQPLEIAANFKSIMRLIKKSALEGLFDIHTYGHFPKQETKDKLKLLGYSISDDFPFGIFWGHATFKDIEYYNFSLQDQDIPLESLTAHYANKIAKLSFNRLAPIKLEKDFNSIIARIKEESANGKTWVFLEFYKMDDKLQGRLKALGYEVHISYVKYDNIDHVDGTGIDWSKKASQIEQYYNFLG